MSESGMSDAQIRAWAILVALQCEGPKAVTTEVLEAAEAIYAFLKGGDDLADSLKPKSDDDEDRVA